jgi:hypothetical protein
MKYGRKRIHNMTFTYYAFEFEKIQETATITATAVGGMSRRSEVNQTRIIRVIRTV